MGRALALAIIACIAGCYQSPSLASCKYRCGGANNESCPSGYACTAGMCVAPGEGCTGDGGVIDAPPGDDGDVTDAPDAPIDADPNACATPGDFAWVKVTSVTTSSLLRRVVALDANNDGKMDLVVLDEAAAIGFFAGNGNGTFGARVGSTTGANPLEIITGDFDRDQQQDDVIVLQGMPNPAQAILKSNGNGTFSRTGIALAMDTPVDVATIGDVDGNTFEDVAFVYTTGAPRIQVVLQISTGTGWQLGANVATNAAATSLVFGDVNGDTVSDGVVTLGSQLGFHEGVSLSTDYTLSTILAANVNAGPVDAVIGRLRTAGLPSVVTVNSTANNVSLRHALPIGGFSDGGNPAVGTAPKAIALANIGGSALPDIITANSTSNSISVLVNQDGTWAGAASTLTDMNPVDLVSADFDGDLRVDLAVATPGQSTVTILLNKCPP